jgi:hypothetical protein
MSWARHNPELYDEMCERGIVKKILQTVQESFDDVVDEDDVTMIVATLHDSAPRVWDELNAWASDEASDEIREHFAGIADGERKRRKEMSDG